MRKSNSEIRQDALAALDGNWKEAVLAAFVVFLISSALGSFPGVGPILTLLVTATIGWGFNITMWKKLRYGTPIKVGAIFTIFDPENDTKRISLTIILMNVYILLWSLLLIVPGIIKSISYAMTAYILKDEPTLSYNAAIERSMEMMNGHKMRLFMVILPIIGWTILGIITVIGIFWVIPYADTTLAAFYEDLKNNPERA